MADVFISYCHEDGEAARRIALALTERGFSVWRDEELPAFRPFADVIEEQLAAACCVLVLWSTRAVGSQWVRSEAEHGRLARKLIQATLDGTVPPMPFEQLHNLDLRHNETPAGGPHWQYLVEGVAALRGGAAPSFDAVSDTGRPMASGAPASAPLLPAGRPSVAVLPFEMRTRGELPDFAEAIAEDISTALARWRWFLVISSRSTNLLSSHRLNVDAVSRELGARYVVGTACRSRAGGSASAPNSSTARPAARSGAEASMEAWTIC